MLRAGPNSRELKLALSIEPYASTNSNGRFGRTRCAFRSMASREQPQIEDRALDLRHAGPWARKMSATSRRGRGGDRLAMLRPSRSKGSASLKIAALGVS